MICSTDFWFFLLCVPLVSYVTRCPWHLTPAAPANSKLNIPDTSFSLLYTLYPSYLLTKASDAISVSDVKTEWNKKNILDRVPENLPEYGDLSEFLKEDLMVPLPVRVVDSDYEGIVTRNYNVTHICCLGFSSHSN